MLTKIILFLIRRKLKVKKYRPFMLDRGNKELQTIYFFSEDRLWKFEFGDDSDLWNTPVKASSVSLNYLLSDECLNYDYNIRYYNRVLEVIRANRGAG